MITVIANLKGGSGKSTITFNLGIWLATKGQPVVAYDLDPQCTLLDVAEVRREEGYAPPFQVYQTASNIADNLRHHNGEVLVDVGAANLDAMKEALVTADRIVIPVPPSQADVWATQRFLGILKDAETNPSTEILAFVNRADTHHAVRESDETAEALSMLSGIILMEHRLRQRTIFRRSFSEGLAVFELMPGCKSAVEFEELASALYPQFA